MAADYIFFDRVKDRAYFKYLDRKRYSIPDNPVQDWDDAIREQSIDERIRDEAYLHSLNDGNNPQENWNTACHEIMERLNLLAFSLHEADYDKSPAENWINAQKLYLDKF